MINKLFYSLDKVKENKPLVHCITNPISINQCANIILSIGAKPIMAEHPMEVLEITDTADVLMLNIGNITDARMKSILISLKKAKKRGIPVLLDIVGVACSSLRKRYVKNLLKISIPDVIKGNYSEILALADKKYSSPGVDSIPVEIDCIKKAVTELSVKYKTVVLATGKTDIVSDGRKTIYVNNGTQKLTSVTGTGCMLGALCSVLLTALSPFDAAVSACVYFGICGELSQTDKGNGSFMTNLIDKISTLREEEMSEFVNMEEI